MAKTGPNSGELSLNAELRRELKVIRAEMAVLKKSEAALLRELKSLQHEVAMESIAGAMVDCRKTMAVATKKNPVDKSAKKSRNAMNVTQRRSVQRY